MKKISVLFCVTFFVYLFSFGNQFVWDDEQFIVENAYVQHLESWPNYFTTSTTAGAGIISNYYRPLTTFSFAIDYAIWGAHPFGFHITNTVLHALGAVLVYLVLRQMLLLYSHDKKYDLLAYLTAFAFALHPVQVEAVVYINSRGDSLSLVYGAASVLLFIKVLTEKLENKRILWGAAAFLAYLTSLFTKETSLVWMGVSVLFVLALAMHKKKIRPGMYVVLGLEAVAAAIYFCLRFTVLQFQSAAEIWGTANPYANSIAVRVATFLLGAVPQYVQVLVWPTTLHMERTVPILQHLNSVPLSGALTLLVLTAALLGYAVLLIKKGNTFPHPFLLGSALLILCIAPFSGVVPLNAIMYEHWLYVPMIGWWLACLYLVQKMLPSKVFTALAIGVLSIWGVMSIRQMLIWRSPLTLYPYILKYSDSARIHMNLGMAYAEGNEVNKAIPEYNRAVELSDQYPQTHHNLGNAYATLGQYDKAEAEYVKALAIDPTFRFSLRALIQLEVTVKNKAAAQKWALYAKEKLPSDQEFASIYQQIQSAQW